MVGNPARLYLACQAPQLRQVLKIERVGAADGERNAVHHDGVALGDLLQDVPRAALGIEKVLRDDLEPIDRGPLLENVPEVHAPQAHAKPELGEQLRPPSALCRIPAWRPSIRLP